MANMQMEKTPMPEQEANVRNANFKEVALGYTKNHTRDEQLVLEDFFQSGRLAQELIEAYAESCGPK